MGGAGRGGCLKIKRVQVKKRSTTRMLAQQELVNYQGVDSALVSVSYCKTGTILHNFFVLSLFLLQCAQNVNILWSVNLSWVSISTFAITFCQLNCAEQFLWTENCANVPMFETRHCWLRTDTRGKISCKQPGVELNMARVTLKLITLVSENIIRKWGGEGHSLTACLSSVTST